jgi:hypothetical protein
MYTAQDIKGMDRQETQSAFDALATRHYGTDRWKTDFAKTSGVSYPGVQQWFTARSQPPAWSFLLVQAWIERDAAIAHLRSIKTALEFTVDLMDG